jgi:hypothetical protein
MTTIKELNGEQLEELKDDLNDVLEENIEEWLFDEIFLTLDSNSIKQLQDLFDDYYESSLSYLGIKPIEYYLYSRK